MQYGYFGQDIRILIEFRGALNLASPDPGTMVQIDVLGDDGAPIVPLAPIPPLSQSVDVGSATQYLFVINKETQPLDVTVVRREVRATFTYQGGRPGEVRIPYTIISYMNHGASEEAVRGYLGLTLNEVPDAVIDLHVASLRALWDIGPSFEDALAAFGQTRESARMVVILQAAFDLLPSIKMRVAQTITDGTRQFSRFL